MNDDSISLDCNGYTIRNPSFDRRGNGITVWGKRQVTIQNCTVWDWDRGISIDYSNDINLYNNNVSNNDDGYDINSSTGVYVRGGYVAFNGGDGIDLDNVSSVEISGVEIAYNADKGITVNRPDGSTAMNSGLTIVGNYIHDNGTGIRLEWVTGGNITQNTFNGQTGANILFKVGRNGDRVSSVSVNNNTCLTGVCTPILQP
jgi:parallel beta-helix repeat protein